MGWQQQRHSVMLTHSGTLHSALQLFAMYDTDRSGLVDIEDFRWVGWCMSCKCTSSQWVGVGMYSQ